MTERLLFGVIPVYGALIALSILMGVFLCARDEQRLSLPKDTAVDMALFAVPLAIVGARLYYVAFQWDMFKDDPVSILYLWEGGLAIYGAVIGGALGCWLLARKKKLRLSAVIDMAIPSLLLGQAIGRWGNFINGEAYGELITDPAWQFFPAAVYVGGAWHMATFFYESLWNAIGFALLYTNRKKTKRGGDMLIWYLLWYGAGRMVIEGLRTDSLMLGSVRVSQLVSLGMCLAAMAVLAIRCRKPAYWLALLVPVAHMACYAMTGNVLLSLAGALFALAGGWSLYAKTPRETRGA